MPHPRCRPVFVAIDGPNGVGKTTTITALVRLLESRGSRVRSVRQPSDTDLGGFIRQAEGRYSGLTLAALVVADRVHLVDTVIRPALAAGEIVITDRHVASTLALQQLDGLDLELLWELNAGVLMPDLSVFLDAPPTELESRLDIRGRTSRFERTEDISARERRHFAKAAERMRAGGVRIVEVSTSDNDLGSVVATIAAAIDA